MITCIIKEKKYEESKPYQIFYVFFKNRHLFYNFLLQKKCPSDASVQYITIKGGGVTLYFY